MKKNTIILAVAILVSVIASSCSSSKKCPAYSQVKTEKVQNNS